jgi:hypothetical protein
MNRSRLLQGSQPAALTARTIQVSQTSRGRRWVNFHEVLVRIPLKPNTLSAPSRTPIPLQESRPHAAEDEPGESSGEQAPGSGHELCRFEGTAHKARSRHHSKTDALQSRLQPCEGEDVPWRRELTGADMPAPPREGRVKLWAH